MTRRLVGVLAAATTVVWFSFVADSPPRAAAVPATAGNPIVVKMIDAKPFLAPAKLTIRVGATVEWVNEGETVHSVSTEKAAAHNPRHVALPKGAAAFDSGFIPPGATYSYTFQVPGTYHYFCLAHPKDGMVGEVVVRK